MICCVILIFVFFLFMVHSACRVLFGVNHLVSVNEYRNQLQDQEHVTTVVSVLVFVCDCVSLSVLVRVGSPPL